MPTREHNPNDRFRMLAAGNLDALSPAQVEALEAALNSEPDLAARLVPCRPPVSPQLAAALRELDRDEQPSPGTWERVWSRIDAAGASAQGRRGAAWRRVSVWRPMLAAAACLLLMVGWRLVPSTAAEPWPLQLAGDVEIDELEVFQDATSFIVSMGNGAGRIIWVLPDGDSL